MEDGGGGGGNALPPLDTDFLYALADRIVLINSLCLTRQLSLFFSALMILSSLLGSRGTTSPGRMVLFKGMPVPLARILPLSKTLGLRLEAFLQMASCLS